MARLIGLGGYAGAGKDAVADVLTQDHGWQKTYMSKPLETALLKLNPWVNTHWSNWKDGTFPKNGVGYETHMRYADLHGLLGYDRSKECHDVRDYLQKLGTEVGRNMLHRDVWVWKAFEEVDAALLTGKSISITGMRFWNELAWIRDRDGILVWVERPGYGPVNGHASDNTLSRLHFDLAIENDGTLEDLASKVAVVLQRFSGRTSAPRRSAEHIGSPRPWTEEWLLQQAS